jgi:hypothetical protein
MKIIHRVATNASPDMLADLQRLGVAFKRPAHSSIVSFEVSESHKGWPHIHNWIVSHRMVDVVRTEFSPAELSSARWLHVVPDWHHGYPEPDSGNMGYRAITYDMSGSCPTCGAGLRQKAPFQMRGEPRWGRRGILQLNWIFDEYYVKPEVWAKVFEPLNIGARPVQSGRGVELKTVVQLDVTEEVDVSAEDFPREHCLTCGRTKWLPVTRGFSPPLVGEPKGHIAKTRQNFGSGFSARRLVLISQVVRQALIAEGIRGASMRPVAADTAHVKSTLAPPLQTPVTLH